MSNWIKIPLLVALFAVTAAAQNPVPQTIPNGLPESAYNVPTRCSRRASR